VLALFLKTGKASEGELEGQTEPTTLGKNTSLARNPALANGKTRMGKPTLALGRKMVELVVMGPV
jgi:hypothetical protein